MAATKDHRKKRRTRTARRSPRGSLPVRLPPWSQPVGAWPEPLIDEQRDEILDRLPLSDPTTAESAIAAIEISRLIFQVLRDAEWRHTRDWRDARATELDELVKRSESMAECLAEMSPDARVLASPVELVDGGPHERTFALGTGDGESPEVPRRDVPQVVYNGARLLAERSAEAADRLRKPMKRGPPPDFPTRALAERLADLWLQVTDVSLAPHNREESDRNWPFWEFVKAVGCTVDADFDGYRVVKRVCERRRRPAQP